ncbi:MAG: hypothetical protein ACI9FR_000068 [Cryomorphaceae bacterium]|jgi:hypothetical protein
MKSFVHNRYIKISLRLSLTAALVITLASCQTLNRDTHSWPSNIPARSIFVDAYETQVAAGINNERLHSHLGWVLKFYQGTVLYPTGWNGLIERLVNSLENFDDQTLARSRLELLGLAICIEWAQTNSARNIDSANIAVWGSALRSSVERGDQFSFINKVEADAADLIAGKLNPRDISLERYYPTEDYDNF